MSTTDPSPSDPSRGRLRLRPLLAAAALGLTLACAGGATAAEAATGGANTVVPGVDVAAVQTALGLTADGVYGPQTRRAVKRFQRKHGLAVDGIVGPQTARELGVVARKASKAKAPSKLLARIAEC